MYNIAETFNSINGEGKRAGQLASFIRFCGCNLRCSYCDTKWANDVMEGAVSMTEAQIVEWVKSSGIYNVTITGGEPLIQDNIYQLLVKLAEYSEWNIEVETNGSVYLEDFQEIENGPSMTMDYKLPSSGMEACMNIKNMELLTNKDTIKFVVGTDEDLERAGSLIKMYDLTARTSVYLSPVFGEIPYERIVQYMLQHQMNGVNMQLQLHKFIWDPSSRGV